MKAFNQVINKFIHMSGWDTSRHLKHQKPMHNSNTTNGLLRHKIECLRQMPYERGRASNSRSLPLNPQSARRVGTSFRCPW